MNITKMNVVTSVRTVVKGFSCRIYRYFLVHLCSHMVKNVRAIYRFGLKPLFSLVFFLHRLKLKVKNCLKFEIVHHLAEYICHLLNLILHPN